MINSVVKEVSKAVRDPGKPKGRGWSWFVISREGVKVSLFYEESMGNYVEVLKPRGVLREYSTRPDSWGIAYIDVADLRYCF